MNKHFEYIIIGAGLSGSLVAHRLAAKGISHLILDKSKGVGGRVASRRVGELTFNHGVNDFDLTPKQEQIFSQYFSKVDFTPPATNAIKKILVGCNLKKESKVIGIRKLDQYEVTTEAGEVYHCKNLILTAPAPQTLDLIRGLGFSKLESLLSDVSYSKRIILFSHSEMKFMDDHFSETNFELSDDQILAMNESFGFDSVKKWRYEKVTHGIPLPYWSEAGLSVIGDCFNASPENGVGAALESAHGLLGHLHLL